MDAVTNIYHYNIDIKQTAFDGEPLYEAKVQELPDIAEYSESREEAYALALDAIATTAEIFKEQGRAMPEPLFPPIHPGEILTEEFLKPMGIGLDDLAKSTGIEPSLLKEIAAGIRPITTDTALRLSRHFKLSERFWMTLQSRYDSEIASQSNAAKISEA
jgi:addiction module HigA family antidote